MASLPHDRHCYMGSSRTLVFGKNTRDVTIIKKMPQLELRDPIYRGGMPQHDIYEEEAEQVFMWIYQDLEGMRVGI